MMLIPSLLLQRQTTVAAQAEDEVEEEKEEEETPGITAIHMHGNSSARLFDMHTHARAHTQTHARTHTHTLGTRSLES